MEKSKNKHDFSPLRVILIINLGIGVYIRVFVRKLKLFTSRNVNSGTGFAVN